MEMLDIARTVAREMGSEKRIEDYLDGVREEVSEVYEELKDGNRVYLEDELADIMWDYANVLALCEQRGLISSVESVMAHGAQKYAERTKATFNRSQDEWNAIKAQQKEELKKRHIEMYGGQV